VSVERIGALDETIRFDLIAAPMSGKTVRAWIGWGPPELKVSSTTFM